VSADIWPILWSIEPSTIDAEIECDEPCEMLAHLLINEVAFLNAHCAAMFKGGSQEGISINVLCSDTFGYACADCERLDYDQIQNLYRMWRRDPLYGSIAWCVARRKDRPIKPVADRLIERGHDLDALLRGEMP
jgi:hypothetical protein